MFTEAFREYGLPDSILSDNGAQFAGFRKGYTQFERWLMDLNVLPIWFLYQLNLAWKLKLPVILHVRDAHEDALRILRMHPARKLGGVIHYFNGNRETTQKHLKLGYPIGIGGSIVQQEERAKDLWEAVRCIPLNRIPIETDAPFILPYCKDTLPPKLLRRARNTSMILPEVIRMIAELKNISADIVEQTTMKM